MKWKNGNPKKSSRFICLHCLEENRVGLGIQRRGKQREKDHIKDLFCINCNTVTKNLEVRYCDDFTEEVIRAMEIQNDYYSEENTFIRKAGSLHV